MSGKGFRHGVGRAATRRVREGRIAPTPPLLYLESSAVAAAWLEGDAAAIRAMDAPGRKITSAITFAEVRRAVLRAQASGRISVAQARTVLEGLGRQATQCQLVGVTDEVLARVGRAFPVEPVRTLDAIHLATLELVSPAAASFCVITRDERVASNVRAMGLALA